jgi:hypothetical protein
MGDIAMVIGNHFIDCSWLGASGLFLACQLAGPFNGSVPRRQRLN